MLRSRHALGLALGLASLLAACDASPPDASAPDAGTADVTEIADAPGPVTITALGWRTAVALPGRARVGHWLSGALALASDHAAALRWDADGAGITVRVRFTRDATPEAWTAWTTPTAARTVPLGDGARRVQVLAAFSGDGASTPALRSVTLDCAP